MKAIVLRQGGNIQNLHFEELDIPAIKPDELLIKVHAVSLNPSDYQTIEFLGDLEKPVILGIDIAGEIAGVGEKVENYSVGDRVFYLREINNPYGGFSEYAVVHEKFVCKIPKGMDDIHAAALPGAGMTAYHIMYDRFHLHAGRTILIHGGAGGVGSYLIQLAKLNGLYVITTCSNTNFEYVKRLGADVAIDYRTENVYRGIDEITKHSGVDYVVNTISGNSATEDMKIMKFGSELAAVAGLPDMANWKFYEKGLSIHEIAFGNYLAYPDKELQKIPAETAGKISELVASNKITTPDIYEIEFEEVPSYLQKMKEKKVFGKIVAKIQ